MEEPTKEVQAERERVLDILESHRKNLGSLYVRLWNLVNSGVDLKAEMEKPIEDRATGFHWPDAK